MTLASGVIKNGYFWTPFVHSFIPIWIERLRILRLRSMPGQVHKRNRNELENFSKVLRKLGKILIKLEYFLRKIWRNLKKILVTLWNFLDELGETLRENLKKFWKNVGNFLENLGESREKSWKILEETLVSFRKILEKFKGKFKKSLEKTLRNFETYFLTNLAWILKTLNVKFTKPKKFCKKFVKILLKFRRKF